MITKKKKQLEVMGKKFKVVAANVVIETKRNRKITLCIHSMKTNNVNNMTIIKCFI